MIAQSTTTSPVTQHVAADPVLERVAWALVVAVVGLLVREIWQAWRSRKESRARDRAILSAVLRELSVVSGVAGAIAKDVNRERKMLAENQRWRLKPLVRFPTAIYTLVADRVPASLLKNEEALPYLVRIQAQCEYSNALADEHQKWKTPEARGQPDQIETILSFHEGIMESVNAVVDGCNKLQPLIVEAGDAVGGLNLAGPPPRAPRWQRFSHPLLRLWRPGRRSQPDDDRPSS